MDVGTVVAVAPGILVTVGTGTLVAVGVAVDCGEGEIVEDVGSVVVGVGEIVCMVGEKRMAAVDVCIGRASAVGVGDAGESVGTWAGN